ncbi:hypothetical protein H6A64_06800 [Lacrimispora saccharolytica]|nr:hypothetical protein [Lacrimispora saccharolytica]
MRGITIILNNERFHTGNDLDLVQEKKEIGKPDIQSYTVQIPGRNGLLNLTKGLTGKVNYYNRPLSFQYFGTGKRERLLWLDKIMSFYHGETVRIIDDDYPEYYYEGEASVSTEFHPNYITITLSVDAQPYRKRLVWTTRRYRVTGSANLCIQNENMPVIPEITVTDPIGVTHDKSSYDLTEGTYKIDDFELARGNNIFEVSGSGIITFKYQEGTI